MEFYSLKTNNEIFISNPFGPPSALRIENYELALSAFNVPVYFMNSVIVSVATVGITLALAVMFGFCRTIPLQMEEAAFIDVATMRQSFTGIILPLLKPATATTLTPIFLAVWNEFTPALIIIRSEALKALTIGARMEK